jgi:hypothetical protein
MTNFLSVIFQDKDMDRRTVIAITGLAACLPSLALAASKPFVPAVGPRCRVLFANDLSGDIDGLFATVHALLSTSFELRGLIGTLAMNRKRTAAESAELAQEMARLTRRSGQIPVFTGVETKLATPAMPLRSNGVQAIIDEARRTDTTLPLYVLVGGGLTEVASALMLAPDIASRFTLVWNGCDEWPKGGTGETNFMTDPLAAMHIYNQTDLRIWQVPRSAFGATIISAAEVQAYVAPHGAIGAWLYRKLVEAPALCGGRLNMGATWSLGDSPLVLLTALNDWVPNSFAGGKVTFEGTSSSPFDEVVAPLLNPDGSHTARETGRKIRIYRSVDVRLMMSDFFAKLKIAFPER